MGPLSGVKVIEMSGLAPGPYCAMLLADLGAEVLRIAKPDESAPLARRFQALHRNRRSIGVDLKSTAGVSLAMELISRADALIEGYRPGVMEKLGLGPASCLERNPSLVYGRMTGWGQTGPLASLGGHDINYIALAGVLDSVGEEGRPPSIPLNVVGDFGGGGLFLAFGIVSALLERTHSGKGQVIDAAMIDGASSLMSYMHGVQASGAWRGRGTSAISGAAPHYSVYKTSDNRYVSVGASEQKYFEKLIRLMGLQPGALADHRDPANWEQLKKIFAGIFEMKTRAEWIDLLQHEDVCFAPVLGIEEVESHPHQMARNAFVSVGGEMQSAPAPRFSRTTPHTPTPGVHAGVDIVAALGPWGYTPEKAQELKSAGIAS